MNEHIKADLLRAILVRLETRIFFHNFSKLEVHKEREGVVASRVHGVV